MLPGPGISEIVKEQVSAQTFLLQGYSTPVSGHDQAHPTLYHTFRIEMAIGVVSTKRHVFRGKLN